MRERVRECAMRSVKVSPDRMLGCELTYGTGFVGRSRLQKLRVMKCEILLTQRS